MSDTDELLQLTQRLLDSIASADWATYTQLCDPSLTCFEPEAQGNLVEGMPFHRFYFDLGAAPEPRNTTISRPHVRVMGDVAVVSYVRLNQRVDAVGHPTVTAIEETRVWQRQTGGWRHVHFHRSAIQ
jgi:calcium/calmodulin-dependent protein kinase (CaM kinase) II